MKFENYMILEIPSKSANESFARAAVACFASQKISGNLNCIIYFLLKTLIYITYKTIGIYTFS